MNPQTPFACGCSETNPTARSGGAALARPHQLSCLGSGVAPPPSGDLATPHVRIRAVVDLPQAAPTQTPLVAHRHPSRLDNECEGRLDGWPASPEPLRAPRRIVSPGPPLPRKTEVSCFRDAPCRAASYRHSRKRRSSTAPEVPSTHETPLLAGSHLSPPPTPA